MRTDTYEARRDICAVHVTLNGKPATISGALVNHGTVSSLDGELSAQWSWPAIERIVNTNKQFKL